MKKRKIISAATATDVRNLYIILILSKESGLSQDEGKLKW